jgi:hypothetical protein
MQNVTPGHFELTPEQRQFKKLIDLYPLLASYWDFDQRECDLAAIKADIGALSSGEQIMLRFFVAVWLGENRLNFDLIEATKTLDDGNLDDIRQWLNQPVFP